MTSAVVIVGTSLLLAALWILAQIRGALKEFGARGRSWILQSVAVIAVIEGVSWIAGLSGILNHFEFFPPPMMGFFVAMVAMAGFLGFSKFGTMLVKHCTFAEIIGFQSFRLLAELSLILGLREGLAPVQLTMEGYQFDVITALTAIPLALVWRTRRPVTMTWLWNLLGCALLLVIAFIAITSFPTPLRIFTNEPSNVWVTHAPYTLLPGVLVVFALAGHIWVFRKLLGK